MKKIFPPMSGAPSFDKERIPFIIGGTIFAIVIYIIITIIVFFVLPVKAVEWQFGDMQDKYKKLVRIKCIDTVSHGKYLYYYLPNSHWNIVYLNEKEEMVRCEK
jgi:hypothetical protein